MDAPCSGGTSGDRGLAGNQQGGEVLETVRRHGDENRKVQHGSYALVRRKAAVEQDNRPTRGIVGHRLARPARRRIIAGGADARSGPQGCDQARQHIDTVSLLGRGAWFAPGRRVCLLPDWETLPYDAFSPHQDLVSERLAALYAIAHRTCDVVIVPASKSLKFVTP